MRSAVPGWRYANMRERVRRRPRDRMLRGVQGADQSGEVWASRHLSNLSRSLFLPTSLWLARETGVPIRFSIGPLTSRAGHPELPRRAAGLLAKHAVERPLAGEPAGQRDR